MSSERLSSTKSPRSVLTVSTAWPSPFEVAHDRHQQRLTGEAALDQELALEQSIDLAVALAVDRIVPVVERGAPMIEVADRLDRGVGEGVDLVERLPDLAGQVDVDRLELAERALLGVAVAEIDPAVGDRRLAADRRVARLRQALRGFAEADPGEAEDDRRGEEAEEAG